MFHVIYSWLGTRWKSLWSNPDYLCDSCSVYFFINIWNAKLVLMKMLTVIILRLYEKCTIVRIIVIKSTYVWVCLCIILLYAGSILQIRIWCSFWCEIVTQIQIHHNSHQPCSFIFTGVSSSPRSPGVTLLYSPGGRRECKYFFTDACKLTGRRMSDQ